MSASLCGSDWEDLLVYEFSAHQECTPRSWTCIFYQNSMAFFSDQIVYSTPRFGHTAQGYNLRRTRGKARPVPSSRPMLCWIDLDPDIRHQYSDVHRGTNSEAHTSVWRFGSRRRYLIPVSNWSCYCEVSPTHSAVKQLRQPSSTISILILLQKKRHDVHPAPTLEKRSGYGCSNSYRKIDTLL